MKHIFGRMWSSEQRNLEAMSASHSELLDMLARGRLELGQVLLSPGWRGSTRIQLPTQLEKRLYLPWTPGSTIAGRMAFQAISSDSESQTAWSSIFCLATIDHVRRKNNKETGAPTLKDRPCIHPCLGPTPLSVSGWKAREAKAFICGPLVSKFP